MNIRTDQNEFNNLIASLSTIGVKKEKTTLRDRLNSEGYICSTNRANSIELAINNTPVRGAIIKGSTGSGKTYLPEVLSKTENAKLFYQQCYTNTDEFDLIQKLTPHESSVSGIRLSDNVILNAIENSKKEKTILCLDEYDKSRPSADSILLEFLQTGGIHFNNHHHQGNLDNLIIFVCCNEERELSDYLTRRLSVLYFDRLKPNLVAQALKAKFPDNDKVIYAYFIYKAIYNHYPHKVVSVQELCQLVHAITPMETIDWNDILFQFITKEKQTHDEIMKVLENASNYSGSAGSATLKKEINKLLKDTFEAIEPNLRPEFNQRRLKSVNKNLNTVQLRSFKYDLTEEEESLISKEVESSGGVIELRTSSYSEIADLFIRFSFNVISKNAKELLITSSNSTIINKAKVERQDNIHYLVFDKPFNFKDYHNSFFSRLLSLNLIGQVGLEYSNKELTVKQFYEKLADKMTTEHNGIYLIVKSVKADEILLEIANLPENKIYPLQIRYSENKFEGIVTALKGQLPSVLINTIREVLDGK